MSDNRTPDGNDDPAPPLDHPDYPEWSGRRVGAELKRRRLALGKTAMGLAAERPRWLSDQTILNNESGRRNPGFVTLERHCQLLGCSLRQVLETVAGES